jgi:hypothetical protein
MESWQSVTSAVELGHIRGPGKTATDTPDPVLDHSQAIILPTYQGSIVTGSMGPQKATASPLPKVRPASSIAQFSYTIAAGDQALSPGSTVELSSLGVSLGSARFRCTLQSQRPQDVAHLPELQPGTEPNRIRNGVTIGLLDCGLDQPGIHPAPANLQAERSKPQDCALVLESPEPNMRRLDGFSPEGLPTECHTRLERKHYAPAVELVDIRPIAPRLRVPLPAPPRMR